MIEKKGKILIVDDDVDVLQAAELYLKKHVEKIVTERDPKYIESHLEKENFDVILLDMNFTRDASSGKEGFFWLDKIISIDPSLVVILITAFGGIEMAVRAIKAGATDFIQKPWHNEKLLATINSGMKLKESKKELLTMRSRQKQLSEDMDHPFQNFIGTSPSMQTIFRTIEKVAKTDANVLILGGNGTGKELAARALHRQSTRSAEVFISVDMGAISETLFESELFGHVRGAFTDAKDDRAGRFEVASKGTLFLDEIGNLSLPLQAKLLSILQTRKVTRVGSDIAKDVDIRLICATNMPIHDMVANKEFRQDLLYRVNTVEINLPPLQERIEDIPILINHFLDQYSKKYNRDIKSISRNAMNKLAAYSWPGNVRELQHAIERAVIMSDESEYKSEDFFLSSGTTFEENLSFDNLKLDDVEKEIIQRAIKKHGGNITRAAQELGLTRTSLYRRLDKYDI